MSSPMDWGDTSACGSSSSTEQGSLSYNHTDQGGPMALRSRWRPNKEEVVAPHGMVTAMQPPAAEAGLEILQQGGNAVDAAVAIGFCNVVLEPYMATIGGMGYMLIHLAATGKTVGIDFNGRAPQRASATMYKVTGPGVGSYQLAQVEGDANARGPLSITVPGTCAGFCTAHRLYGKLPLEQVMEPAIHLATEGFEANFHVTLTMANEFAEIRRDPYLARMWLPNDAPPRSDPKPGDRIVQKDLGMLLQQIARHGPEVMYRGEVAEAIDHWMRRHGGILTRDDLAAYTPQVAAPLSVPFHGYTVRCVATPSGALTNLQTLHLLNQFDLSSFSPHSADYLHLLIEAFRHTFADRYRFLGDWEHAPVPLQGLLSEAYARAVAGQLDLRQAAVSPPPDQDPWDYYLERAVHDPWTYDPQPGPATGFSTGTGNDAGHTTHLNVVDKDRNAVSCTHTGTFNSGVHPDQTGVYLVAGMAWFMPRPGYANSIAPWKRPLNNMCPVMVFRDGRPVACQGAPGGRKIMNRGVQVLANMLVFGMQPQEAVVAPTVDASGRHVLVDSRIPEPVIQSLQSRGHRVQVVEEEPGPIGNFARPSAIWIDYDSGLLHAGVDAFRPAMALGY
ncbi:MAG: gamma-glutamyltransferase family protein [Nitrospinota bacterium]|nr:MAG: gamma-glutamyltransferase family protein [Nitrospinota bacterium]